MSHNHQKKILISHSGRQYVHRLLNALKVGGHCFDFFTSFAYLPDNFPFRFIKLLPGKFRGLVEKELRKRSFSGTDASSIRQFPVFEFLREASDKIFKNRFAEKTLYFRDRLHDRWVASRLNSESYDLVIGYEECCALTFAKAKNLGMTTVLDLAQIHYKSIEKLSNRFPFFSEIYKDQKLRTRINAIKERELRLADYIVCLSQFAKKSLVEHGYPENKVFVVNLGFDPEVFKPKQVYSYDGPLKLVFSGTITRRKGIDQLLRLKHELGNLIELTLIGPMSDAIDLVRSQSQGLIVYEYLEQQELCKVLQTSDVFVFPSYLDSWAMVVIEAMACGLPVIISDHTGAQDALTGNEGFIIPAGDYEQLKQKVSLLLQDRAMLETMGKQAAATASQYTWSNYYQSLNHVMNHIRLN